MLCLFLALTASWKKKTEEPYVSFRQEYAQEGEELNVICNHYPAGTAFSFAWFVDDIKIDNTTDTYVPVYEDLGKFIRVTVTPDHGYPPAEATLYFSRLPVLYIDVVDNDPIYSKEFYFEADLRIQGNAVYHSLTSEIYNGPIQIKGRGNSTWHFEKVPYRMKLETASDLFQMGKNKHWVLLANAFDDSLMRNKISYDLSGEMGMPYMESTWVDLVLNGEYIGNYQLCEHIRIDENRIDIQNLEDYAKLAAEILCETGAVLEEEREDLENHLVWQMDWLTTSTIQYEEQIFDVTSILNLPEINGGFLFELDAFYDEPSRFLVVDQPIMVRDPKYIGSNDTLMTYIRDYVTAFFFAAFQSEDFYTIYDGEPTHYSQLFDIEALAKYFLVSEIFFNEDAGLKSTYFYKEQDCLAEMGPIWDMDYSSGGIGDRAHIYDQWQVVTYSNYAQESQWYKGLARDPWFLSKVLEYWEEYREVIFHILDEDGSMEQSYSYILESARSNDIRWKKKGEIGEEEYFFENGYKVFKEWMTNHLAWLDGQFTTLENVVDSIGFYEAGYGVSLDWEGENVVVRAEEGERAVFFYNGIRQAEVPLVDGTAVWPVDPELRTGESDVVLVRVYREDQTQSGSDYMDFRQ